MTALVLKPFQVRRDGKIVQYQPGDRIPVKDPRKAAGLVREGFIRLIPQPDSVGCPQAVRIWSEVVGEAIWIILAPEGMQYVQGGEVVYTAAEIRDLAGATPEVVQAIHRIKKVMGGKLVGVWDRKEGAA